MTQQSKNQSDFKLGRIYEQTFVQRRHTDDQQVPEKMLNIIDHQGNENQNHNESSPHVYQNSYYQKDKK